MFAQYTAYKRAFMAKAVLPATGADIPAPELGIEAVENKAPINIKYNVGFPAQSVDKPVIRTMDDILYDGSGAQATPDEFPTLYYMGDSF